MISRISSSEAAGCVCCGTRIRRSPISPALAGTIGFSTWSASAPKSVTSTPSSARVAVRQTRTERADCLERHRQIGVRRHVFQALLREKPGQLSAVFQVDPALAKQRAEAALDLVGQLVFGPVRVQAGQRLQGHVEVLQQQPAPGPDGVDHVPESNLAAWCVDQYEAGVHQVEAAARRIIHRNIMLPDFYGRPEAIANPAHVDIGGHHMSSGTRPDTFGQPAWDRGASRPDLPASPSGLNAALLAGHVYQSQRAAAARLRPAIAVVSAPGPVVVGVFWQEAQATWRMADGTERSGVLTSATVPAIDNAWTGDSVPVWLNPSGDPQPPPLGQYDIILNMLIAATVVLAGAAVLLTCCYRLCRVVVDHNRLTSWGHAWAVTGPQWTSRQ